MRAYVICVAYEQNHITIYVYIIYYIAVLFTSYYNPTPTPPQMLRLSHWSEHLHPVGLQKVPGLRPSGCRTRVVGRTQGLRVVNPEVCSGAHVRPLRTGVTSTLSDPRYITWYW